MTFARKLLTIGSLFAGIGGFELGLERTGGFETVWQCEIDKYCLAVLKKHWPNATRFTDITTLTKPPYVDVLCGGFPCQDISVAGKGKGITGERSGLWKEYARIISEVRPRYVIIENSPMLRTRGLEVVLQDLNSLLYDVEGHCIPASYVGAPHRRDRIWLVAYTNSHAGESRRIGNAVKSTRGWNADRSSLSSHDLADTSSTRLQGHARDGSAAEGRTFEAGSVSESGLPQGEVCNTASSGLQIGADISLGEPREITQSERSSWWAAEPNVGRVANGISSRVDRIKCLGNAVVPQIPTLIGNWILAREARV